MSDCGVCLDQSDGECAEFFVESTVKARKPHRCYECRDDIPSGATYQRIVMKFDGHFDCYRTCAACVEIHRALSSCDREDGHAGYRMTGVLWEDLHEYIFPDMTRACIDKCRTTEAKMKLLEKWNEWKFR